ncbi:O-linked N-acetylglucosamine transferase, SPINDLY family protein [Pseudanabaena mucicola]|uniref:protein O-GlcNAc transferase n=1 Tax=Pseudanabaena mucicola FACHB-723 TaxID=2692860 RepID=A0ABR8A0N5_9CYAN|nr:tetratricopeptide repeat protein [Pseudanabaena mucicola]MBD2189806.1 tetratricopeptide repeat protein [Pseudanabaena mucicola FACHB-723]
MSHKSSNSVETLQIQAYEYLLSQKYQEANDVYTSLVCEESETLENHWYLGICQLLLGFTSNAQETWTLAIKSSENEKLASNELALLLEKESQRLSNIEEFQSSLVIRYQLSEIEPYRMDNLLSIVLLLLQTQNFTSACTDKLNLIGILQKSKFVCLTLDYLLNILNDLLTINFLNQDVLNIVENLCLAHIQYKNQIVTKLVQIINNFPKETQYAVQIIELANRIDPENIDILMQWIDLSLLNSNLDKAHDIGVNLYNLVIKKDDIDKATSFQWVIKSLIWNCNYWEESLVIHQEHESYLRSLAQEDFRNISLKSASFYLMMTGFYSPYFLDQPELDHRLRGEIRRLANQKILSELQDDTEKYRKTQAIRKTSKNLQRPLKIGYFSSFLKRHSVGYLARWLIQYHNRDDFELYYYSGDNGKVQNDPLQQWYMSQFHIVRIVENHNMASFARQIQEDGIDILIDLDSLTSPLGGGVLSLKPAPIQITWLGWDAAGQESIDYFIADPYVLPENADEYYTEKIWRLPQTYIAVDGFESSTPTVRRDTLNIPPDTVIYFSAQISMKRHPDTIRLQMRIVKSVPNSYLVLKSMGDQASLQEFFYQMAEAEGVEKERLRFLPITNSEAEHRANLIIADIVLDTYPYNGATHTLETLWMGIPMVTRVGEQFAARNSYTMMINAGITEGIAWTDEEYVEWGIRLGTDINLRNQVILKLRQGKQTAPLWNSRQFTREMESAYEQMWQIWLDSEDPDIEIDPVADHDLFIAEAELRNQDAIRLAQKGKLDSAIACWQAAISLHPEYTDAHYNMGIAQFQLGQLDQAVESFQITIELEPDHANALYNLGLVLVRQNKLDEAIFAYDQAFAINPEDIDIPLAMGSAFFKQCEWEMAITAYQTALEINAESVTALIGLGTALTEYGNIEEAIACLQSAVSINPDDAQAYGNLGHAFAKANQTEDATFCYQKALQLDPRYGNVFWNFNDILSDIDNPASQNFKLRRHLADQFLESCYETDKIRSLVSFLINYANSGYGDIAKEKIVDIENSIIEHYTDLSNLEVQVLYNHFPFLLSSLRDVRQNIDSCKLIGQLYYQRIIQPKIARENFSTSSKNVSFPLKIGFLSAHFARHPVGWCSLDVIRELSKITSHIYLYATSGIKPDERTEAFAQVAEKYYWYDSPEFIGKVNSFDSRLNQVIADITQDKLDVIIDLDSVTLPLNTHILCREQLAPIRLSWLGFDAPFVSPNNYWLGDRFTHPEGVDEHYLEKILRLPDAHMAVSGFDVIEIDRDIERVKFGISSDQVAYLYAAPARKFNRDSARACISILQQVPNSVLLHKGNGDHEVIRNIYNEICDEIGVIGERVIFLPSYKTEEEHRGIYAIADVFLDSYPYNGGSHNLEVLWFNLPVVTLVGEQSFARMGYSFLQAVGIHEGVANNWDEYITWGVKYGLETELRNSIRQQLINSKDPANLAPLWNPQKLAQDIYNLLKSLCDGFKS